MLGVADKVIEPSRPARSAFALIGGCDGQDQRSYYADLAKAAPSDWMILTLGCGKFRVLGHDYGTVAGLPRLLDMGQCNDSYSAVKVALALADAFGCSINDLPLSLVLSWFEQKAVCVLLALLHLGVKNIRIGRSCPPSSPRAFSRSWSTPTRSSRSAPSKTTSRRWRREAACDGKALRPVRLRAPNSIRARRRSRLAPMRRALNQRRRRHGEAA